MLRGLAIVTFSLFSLLYGCMAKRGQGELASEYYGPHNSERVFGDGYHEQIFEGSTQRDGRLVNVRFFMQPDFSSGIAWVDGEAHRLDKAEEARTLSRNDPSLGLVFHKKLEEGRFLVVLVDHVGKKTIELIEWHDEVGGREASYVDNRDPEKRMHVLVSRDLRLAVLHVGAECYLLKLHAKDGETLTYRSELYQHAGSDRFDIEIKVHSTSPLPQNLVSPIEVVSLPLEGDFKTSAQKVFEQSR